MNIIYDKSTGIILNAISDNIDYETLYFHFDDDFKSNLGSIKREGTSNDLSDYYIYDNELIKFKNESEKSEFRKYNRFLTNNERRDIKLLDKLSPSIREVNKAETTIEVLELLTGVLE